MIKLSIITINLNNHLGLIKTTRSVLAQSSSDFEYIVIDGQSIDGSKDIITKLANSKNYIDITVLSEKDSGIYNAMNKGINIAKGEYIHLLNSGDWLVNDKVVEVMIKELNNLSDNETQPDILVGKSISVRSDGRVRYNHKPLTPISVMTFYRGTIEHTSAYIKRSLFEVVGMYDENYKIVSDWKWYFQALIFHDPLISFTDIYVSYFDTTGISNTNRKLEITERRQVIEELLPKAVLIDYDNYYFAIDQFTRLRRYPIIYKFVYFVERILFKIEKWNRIYFVWKKSNIITP